MTNRPTRLVEKLIVVICILTLIGFLAYDVGRQHGKASVAKNCVAQAGEKLQATIQREDGVTCVFAYQPYRNKITRRAV